MSNAPATQTLTATGVCATCEEPADIGADEVSNHVDADGQPDHDRDADHVALVEPVVPHPLAKTVVHIITTDGQTSQNSFFGAPSEAEQKLARLASEKPQRHHQHWIEAIGDDQDINAVLDAWRPLGQPHAEHLPSSVAPQVPSRRNPGA